MNPKRFAAVLPWLALVRFAPGLAVVAYATKGLIDALVYGHAEFCTGTKYHTICNTVTTAQYAELHGQIQMDWIYLVLGLALVLVGWFVPRGIPSGKGR